MTMKNVKMFKNYDTYNKIKLVIFQVSCFKNSKQKIVKKTQ